MKFWKLRRSRWDAPMPSMEKLSAAGYYAVAEFPDGTSNDSSHFTLYLSPCWPLSPSELSRSYVHAEWVDAKGSLQSVLVRWYGTRKAEEDWGEALRAWVVSGDEG